MFKNFNLHKIPKKISIPLIVATVLGLIITVALSNLEKIVEKVSSRYINGRVHIEDINLSFSEPVIKNITLYDNENNVMFNSDKVMAKISFKNLLSGRIDELNVDSASVNVVRDKDGVINFTKLSKKKSDKKPSNPIDKLVLTSARINYEDYSFPDKLEKKIENIDATVIADKEKLVKNADISITDENIKLNTTFKDESNKELSSLEMKLKIDKFLLDKDLLKSLAKNNEKLEFSDINISSDLLIKTDKTVKNTNIVGNLDVESPLFRYADVDSDIKNIKLAGVFNGRDGEAKLDLNVFDKDRNITVTYQDEELNSVINIDKIDESILNKIKPIRDKKLDLKNINIEDIKTVVHYSDERGLIVKTTMKTNDSEFKGIELNDFNFYADSKDGKKRANAKISAKIKGMAENLTVNLENKDENTDIIVNLKSQEKNSIIPNVNLKAKLENKKDILKAKVTSNIVNFNMDYQKEKKLAKIYDDKFKINYDVNKKNLTDGDGKIVFKIYDMDNYVNFKAKDNQVEIKELKLMDKLNKNNTLIAKGNADLNKKEFNIDYEAKLNSISRKIKDKDIILSFDAKGKVDSKNNIISSQGQINDLSLEYMAKIEKVNGTYDFKKSTSGIEANLKTKIASIGYDKYKFDNFNLLATYSGNEVKVRDFSNNILSFKANYNTEAKKLDGDLNIKRLTDEDIGLDKVDFVLENFKAKLDGDIKNPKAKIDLGTTVVTLPSKDLAKISGKVNLVGNKFIIEGVNVDNNLITGEYDIKEKLLDLKASLSENHLEKYYGGKDLGYTLYGDLVLKGIAGNIDGKLKGRAINLKSSLPDLSYSIDYNAKNYSDGIVSINDLDIVDKNNGSILSLTGTVDLKEKNLNIKNKNDKVDLAKFQNILKNPSIKGIVNTDILINGQLSNPNYSLNMSSSEVSIKNFKINDIILNVTGDKEKANVNKLNLDVYKNLIVGSGSYDIKNKTYNVNMKSNNKIDLSKFKTFFNSYGISNPSGKVDFNIQIDQNDERAYLSLENINLESSKLKLKFSNFSGPITLSGRRIEIGELKAKLNNSPVTIDGFVDLVDIAKLDKEDIIRSLPYKLHIKSKELNYEYPKVIKLKASTDITLTNEELYGNLIIKEATINDIPNNYYRDFFSLIKEQLRKRRTDVTPKKKVDKNSREAQEKAAKMRAFLNKLMPIDLVIKTEKPILIDMDNFNVLVPEVYGKLDIDLNINGKKGNYYLEGETELKDGYFIIGTNEFKVDRALAIYNDNTPLPEINPNIFFESTIDMDDEEYYFTTMGKLNQLRYEITSKTSKVGGDLSALIVNPESNEHIYSYGDGSQIFIVFMKNLIAGQIGQTVFGQTARYVKRKLGLTRFVIRPEIKIYNSEDSVINRYGTTDNKALSPQIYNVNIKVEAKDNIYKDKLYWKASTRLIGTGKDNIRNQTMKLSGQNVREYDVGLEYKIDDSKTLEVGVGTVPYKYRTDDDKDYKRANFYIGYKFRKRYKDFSEIFSF
ncbi:UbiD family decarboxylase [Fusobacterium periodonticum]|uniref:translocation/assembly module TamB domain-containing protein n=1 Tax=Fusobacterium periodonticum TaxID=860 RepID=UPI0028D8C58E|nr:UbiD family decarboxylase [Fusobacterium periodonticum]